MIFLLSLDRLVWKKGEFLMLPRVFLKSESFFSDQRVVFEPKIQKKVRDLPENWAILRKLEIERFG